MDNAPLAEAGEPRDGTYVIRGCSPRSIGVTYKSYKGELFPILRAAKPVLEHRQGFVSVPQQEQF